MKNKILYTNKYILYFVNEVLTIYKNKVSKKTNKKCFKSY